MKVRRVTVYPKGHLWCVLTEFESSVEHRQFTCQAHAMWHMENMLGRM